MSAGYGRGYYGSEQLAPKAKSSKGWFKLAAVAGLGAAIWWWVLPAVGLRTKRKEGSPSYGAAPPYEAPRASYEASHEAPYDAEFEQLARSRGFPSSKAYADAMIAMVDELRAAGAKVELAPHFGAPPPSPGPFGPPSPSSPSSALLPPRPAGS